MEIWKTIPNYSRYEISNMGRIRSMNYKNSGKTVVLKPATEKAPRNAYLKTMIQSDEGKYTTIKIHRMVMLAFAGNSDLVVNHIDGNKLNNQLTNLEYCTHQENIQHSFRMGFQINKKGQDHNNAKLSEQDVLEIREYAKNHAPRYGREALAKKYGVSSAHIKDVVTKRRGSWSHI